MQLKRYTFASLILMILVGAATYTINSEMISFDLMGIHFPNLPIAVWVVVPVVLMYLASVMHMAFHALLVNLKLRKLTRDSEKMLERTSEYCHSKYNKNISDYPNVTFTSDWKYVKSQKFDYTYATLVLQHIFEEELNQYCQDFKNITKKLIVHGRRHNDDKLNGLYKNTWKILENNGLFPISCTLQGNIEWKYSVYGDDLNEHFTCLYKF